MKTLDDAVILAGGQGTRMLPASLYTAKEVMPLIDTPIIHHLIWEACEAGVKRIHIVHSPSKRSQFKKIIKNINLNEFIEKRIDLPQSALNAVPLGIKLELYEQKEPGGIGNAIASVIDYINGPFLLILGDNLLINEHIGPEKLGPKNGSKSSKELVRYFLKHGTACVGIKSINQNDLNKYGVVALDGNLIKEIVEKPSIKNAPSTYILCGRYILLRDTKELLKLYPKNKFGELQSIAIFNHHINNLGLGSVKLNKYDLYDSGDPISWLKSQIDHAIKREDLKEDILQWIEDKIK